MFVNYSIEPAGAGVNIKIREQQKKAAVLQARGRVHERWEIKWTANCAACVLRYRRDVVKYGCRTNVLIGMKFRMKEKDVRKDEHDRGTAFAAARA